MNCFVMAPAAGPADGRARGMAWSRCSVAAFVLAAAAAVASAQTAQPPRAPAAPQPVPPELPAETLTSGGSLAGTTTERVYVADVVISNIVDGRLRVFDARAGKLLGMVNTGYAGNFALSAKADEIYVATTYLSRGGRGERTDIVEVWDSQTLGFKHEIIIPPKRAQTLNYRGLVSVTANGRFLLVQNATPAPASPWSTSPSARWRSRSPLPAAGARCRRRPTRRASACSAVTARSPP